MADELTEQQIQQMRSAAKWLLENTLTREEVEREVQEALDEVGPKSEN